jgi:hypothetical protein
LAEHSYRRLVCTPARTERPTEGGAVPVTARGPALPSPDSDYFISKISNQRPPQLVASSFFALAGNSALFASSAFTSLSTAAAKRLVAYFGQYREGYWPVPTLSGLI